MKINKKRLLTVVIVSLGLTFVIRILTVVSIFGIYSCQTVSCVNHDGSNAKILVGEILQYITLGVFLISLIAYIYYSAKKKP